MQGKLNKGKNSLFLCWCWERFHVNLYVTTKPPYFCNGSFHYLKCIHIITISRFGQEVTKL